MLTSADSEADTILGLDAGANDYITKPFKIGVLLARLRAQLRQHEQSEDAVFTIGPYTFRPSAKLLLDAGARKKVRLTEKETSILKYLYRAGDRIVGRDALLNEVWGYNAGVTTHTLETHVYRLRQKIERDPARAEILVTEPGGYQLVPQTKPHDRKPRIARRLAAILAADVAGYSRMMSADEGGTVVALSQVPARRSIPPSRPRAGRIVKMMGDGALVEFGSVVDAVECAVAVQRAAGRAQPCRRSADRVPHRDQSRRRHRRG